MYSKDAFLKAVDRRVKKKNDAISFLKGRAHTKDFSRNPLDYLRGIYDARDQVLSEDEVVNRLEERYGIDREASRYTVLSCKIGSIRNMPHLKSGLEPRVTENGIEYALAKSRKLNN